MITIRTLDSKAGDILTEMTVENAIENLKAKSQKGSVIIDLNQKRVIQPDEIPEIQDGAQIGVSPAIAGG